MERNMITKEAQDLVEFMETLPDDEIGFTEMEPEEGDVIITEEDMPDLLPTSKITQRKYDQKDPESFDLFLDHMESKIDKVPSHSGRSALGCLRGIHYLKKVLKELSDGFAVDYEGKIDEQKAEGLLKKVNKMIKGLEKRQSDIHEAYDNDGVYAAAVREELVKTSNMPPLPGETVKADAAVGDAPSFECPTCHRKFWTQDALGTHQAAQIDSADDGEEEMATASCDACQIDMMKTAEDEYTCIGCEKVVKVAGIKKEAGTTRFTIVATPFEQAITQSIINGQISNGKSAEATYAHFVEKYKLTPREELSIQQLLKNSGFSYIVDRGLIGDRDTNPIGGGVELASNYWA